MEPRIAALQVPALVACLDFAVVSGQAADPDLIRYRFTEGITNGYRITLESPSETSPRRFEGVIFMAVKSADAEGATLRLQGHLTAQREGSRVYFAQGPWDLAWRVGPLPPFAEARVDLRGRVVRILGIPDLPKLIENCVSVMFQPFPEQPAEEWTTESEVSVDEDAPRGPGMNPGGYYPGGAFPGGGSPKVSGTRKVECRVIESGPNIVRLRREGTFRSWMMTGDQPRLTMTDVGEVVFDRCLGQMRSLQLNATAVVNTPDFTQRTPLVLRVERLEGEDLAKAQPHPTPPRPPAIPESELAQLIEALRGTDESSKAQAISRLTTSDLSPHASALLPVVLSFASQTDPMRRQLAVLVLAKAATAEHVPILLKLLQHDDGSMYPALEALRRLKDKRTIEPLAEFVARGGGTAHQAAEALGEFGPAAEPAALRLLKERHQETRRRAVEILAKAGTNRCLDALRAIVGEDEAGLNHSVTEAIREIRARGEGN